MKINYSKIARFSLVLIGVFSLIAFVGYAIVRIIISTDTFWPCIISMGVLFSILLLISTRYEKIFTVSMLSFCLFIFIICMSACERNYEIIEKDNGMDLVFNPLCFDPVVLYSGSSIDIVQMNGWLNRYTISQIKPSITTMYRIVSHDGKISFSSMFHRSLYKKFYVENADSVQIERRKYFEWKYDIFRVWKSDSIYTVDVRGYNPDEPGYCPLLFINDTNVETNY